MKAKVTSHDQINEITMSEDELIIRVPQGKITINADGVSTKIHYVSRDCKLHEIQTTTMVLDDFTNRGTRAFTLYLISKDEVPKGV